MPVNFRAELLACFGQPVDEKTAPASCRKRLPRTRLNWRYLTVEVAPGKLREAIVGARVFGLRDFNRTIRTMSPSCNTSTSAPDAAVIGAVNTVRREGGRFIGENTDGKGFLHGLRSDAGVDPRGKRAVVLGAGGAARAIVTELALAGAADVLVVNRSMERGEAMVADLAAKTGRPIRFHPWQGVYLVTDDTDLLVNATSIGLYPDVDALPPVDLRGARSSTLVSDVVFNPPETPLLGAARRLGLPTLDGLSMLVYQGAIGFQLWTGREAPAGVMKEVLARAFGV